jgi:hypothetical protein
VSGKVRVSVYDANLNFIAHVPRRKGVRWQQVHNDCGSGSVMVHLDDPVFTAHPTIGNDFNIVILSKGGTAFFAWVIEGRRRVRLGSGEGGDRWQEFSGRGVLSILQRAVVYPEYPLRVDTADDRSFDFGSQDGGWRVTSEWGAPIGIRQDHPSSIRKGYPVNWPDPAAQWIWPTSPQFSTPPGYAYFRGSFVAPTAMRIKIWAAGDERLNLQFDGENVLGVSRGGWVGLTSYGSLDIAAGYHLIAARVDAVQFEGANNPAGFLCSVARVTRSGVAIQWIKRTTPTSFICRPTLSAPPGWFPATILRRLIAEAVTRGVLGFSGITLDFDDTNDTSSSPWLYRRDKLFRVGVDSYLDVVAQLTETDLDVHMTPTLHLQAWKERGTDKSTGSTAVKLLPGRDLTDAEAQSNAARIRSRMLIRHRGGWTEVVDTSAQTTYGRIEGATVAGTTTSDVHAIHVAQSALNDIDSPDITIPIGHTSEKGPQPDTDFTIADTILAPGWSGTMAKGRVMTIAGAEDDATGVIQYATELYPA